MPEATEKDETPTSEAATEPEEEEEQASSAATDEEEVKKATSEVKDVDENDKASVVNHFTKTIRKEKVEGKSLWAYQKETMRMRDGKEKKDDVICDKLDDANDIFAKMVESSDGLDVSVVPVKEFGTSLKDISQSFIMWSKKDGEAAFNVSKAFRRFENYIQWMVDNQKYLEEPLTVDSIKSASEAFPLKLAHDKNGQLAWFIDLGQVNISAVKKELPPKDILRYFVWFSHIVMLDPKAQENGIIFVESLARIAFKDAIGIMPHEINAKIKRLTIGILPIRMKQMYLFNGPAWIKIIIALMRPFMSKKMRNRLTLVPGNKDVQEELDNLVGRNSIPAGFAGMEGSAEDSILGKYFK